MNPADLQLPSLSPSITNKTLPTPQSSAQKNGKLPVPRIDVENTYTQLKGALGDQWADYKATINAFVLGQLNQSELDWVLKPLLTSTPSIVPSTDTTRSPVSTLHLHNTLLASLYANIHRDPPPTEVAPWVVATDKPTAATKNAGATGANDQAEERLKRETMALHARDRRRIKGLKEGGYPVNDGLREMQDYKYELAVKPPDAAPQSAGGLAGKANWDLRRYAQPLASETLEFPTVGDVQSRIDPICAEEGLVGGTQSTNQAVAELVVQATEVYVKEMLSQWFSHVRSNVEGGIQTAKFRRQLQQEEEDAERGLLQRNAAGLLPVQMDRHAKHESMDLQDLRMSLQLSDSYLRANRFLGETTTLSQYPNLKQDRLVANGVYTNGTLTRDERAAADDRITADGNEHWQGATTAAHDELMGVLDDCLAVG